MIVSPSGFWRTAIEKAEHLNITCLRLNEVQEFDWFLSDDFKSFSWKRRVTNILLIPKKDPSKKPTKFTLFDPDGDEFTNRHIEANIHHQINQLFGPTLKEGVHPMKIQMLMEGYRVRDDESGEFSELRHANIYTEVVVSSTVIPIRKVTYENESSGIGIAEIDAGKMSGEIVFSHKKDEGITFSFVPQTKVEQDTDANADYTRHR